jgi:hypothetical protein
MNEYEKQSIGKAVEQGRGAGSQPGFVTRDLPSQQSLSGQQLQALANDYAAKVAVIKRDIELRKFAVDQVLNMVKSSNATLTGDDVVRFMRGVHAFLIAAGEKAE